MGRSSIATIPPSAPAEGGGGGWDLSWTIRYAYDDRQTLVRRQAYDAALALVDDERYLVDTRNPTGYSQVLAAIDGETGQVKRYNTFADELKAQREANGPSHSYLHADALGSIRSLTGLDASGNPLTESYDYTAFGSPYPGEDGDRSLTSYAFTGQWRDPALEMQYHRARWLLTRSATWLSADPIFCFPDGFGHQYAYVSQNPLCATDGSGQNEYSNTGIVSVLPTVMHLVAIRVATAAPGITDFVLGLFVGEAMIGTGVSIAAARLGYSGWKSLRDISKVDDALVFSRQFGIQDQGAIFEHWVQISAMKGSIRELAHLGGAKWIQPKYMNGQGNDFIVFKGGAMNIVEVCSARYRDYLTPGRDGLLNYRGIARRLLNVEDYNKYAWRQIEAEAARNGVREMIHPNTLRRIAGGGRIPGEFIAGMKRYSVAPRSSQVYTPSGVYRVRLE